MSASAILTRLLAESHSLTGRSLTVGDVTVELTDAEFDLVWDLLDDIDDEDYIVRIPQAAPQGEDPPSDREKEPRCP